MELPFPVVVAGTGHRPDKLGGYSTEIEKGVWRVACTALRRLQPTQVISGMALGWDTALAQAAYTLRLPLIAAVPFLGQERIWPEASQTRYHKLLDYARSNGQVVVVSEGGYSNRKLQVRNEWMVDRCTVVLALWNGTPGGTANCLRYAEKVGRPIDNVWEEWLNEVARKG